ncbi:MULTISPECIES: hypothetical protein [unclassified Sphingobacterium]|uniref:hypothetical protein n=1 Tax=unclassified Sphingobacterium TaxID=2609468 RepID=UPI00140449CD|nr:MULTISPECIES: hypothetical protein [unclassified Sphingobacterium]MCS3552623.1 hypothetical protein [Sphingobacterium sp. JUb21]
MTDKFPTINSTLSPSQLGELIYACSLWGLLPLNMIYLQRIGWYSCTNSDRSLVY